MTILNNKKNNNSNELAYEKKQYAKKELLIKRITPHRNHTIFEVNLKTKSISKAEFYDIPTISWEDAVAERFSKYRKVRFNEDCLYLSGLNEASIIKQLKRDYNITL